MTAREKPRHLRRLHFDVDISFLSSEARGHLWGESRDRARALDAACTATFLAFSAHVENTLRRARQPVGETGIREVILRLSADPSEAPEPDPSRRGAITLDIACDPHALLSLPDDRTSVGEWVIARAEQGLDRLESLYAGFPPGPIRDAIHNFRVCDHAFAFRAGERMVPGTRVKGRIEVLVSCLDTRRFFTALYRGRELFRVEIPGIDRPDIHGANEFSGFELEGPTLTIPGHRYWPLDEARRPDHMKPVKINLRDRPKTFELMCKKGWIDAPPDE